MAARSRSLGWPAAFVAATIALALLSSEAMAASSRVCRQLEAELASGGSGSRRAARKQDVSIVRQREQLQFAKRQARRAGCGFRLFGGSNSCSGDQPQDRKNGTQSRSTTAQAVEDSRRRLGPPALADHGGASGERLPRRGRRRRRSADGLDGARNLLDQILRRRHTPARTRSTSSASRPSRRGRPPRQARSRESLERVAGSTTKVVSAIRRRRAVTARSAFAPATAIISRCRAPRLPRTSSATRRTASRAALEPRCRSTTTARPGVGRHGFQPLRPALRATCRLPISTSRPARRAPPAVLAACARNDGPRNFSIVAGNPPAAEPVQPEPVAPYPSSRPDPGADPETLANLDGGLDAETLRRMAVTPKANKSKPTGEDRKIRVVGPVFLPDPEAATDPQAPDPTPVR